MRRLLRQPGRHAKMRSILAKAAERSANKTSEVALMGLRHGIGTIMLVWVHYKKNGWPEKEFLGNFETFNAALISFNESAAPKKFGRRFKASPNNKFVEIGPFLKSEDGEEFLLIDE